MTSSNLTYVLVTMGACGIFFTLGWVGRGWTLRDRLRHEEKLRMHRVRHERKTLALFTRMAKRKIGLVKVDAPFGTQAFLDRSPESPRNRPRTQPIHAPQPQPQVTLTMKKHAHELVTASPLAKLNITLQAKDGNWSGYARRVTETDLVSLQAIADHKE